MSVVDSERSVAVYNVSDIESEVAVGIVVDMSVREFRGYA